MDNEYFCEWCGNNYKSQKHGSWFSFIFQEYLKNKTNLKIAGMETTRKQFGVKQLRDVKNKRRRQTVFSCPGTKRFQETISWAEEDSNFNINNTTDLQLITRFSMAENSCVRKRFQRSHFLLKTSKIC